MAFHPAAFCSSPPRQRTGAAHRRRSFWCGEWCGPLRSSWFHYGWNYADRRLPPSTWSAVDHYSAERFAGSPEVLKLVPHWPGQGYSRAHPERRLDSGHQSGRWYSAGENASPPEPHRRSGCTALRSALYWRNQSARSPARAHYRCRRSDQESLRYDAGRGLRHR
ncbi:hypothetical protein D3C76_956750 [compost metagenome]